MTQLAFLSEIGQAVDTALDELLPAASEEPARLHEAMRYSCFAGGKRIRPVLTVLGGECSGSDRAELLAPAAALEMVHCFSLIHDDLPALDDDDLRRGKPSLHREFDEATAILAGDALLNLALEILASFPEGLAAEGRLHNVLLVSQAAGTAGMIGGQMADIEGERGVRLADPAAQLESIHRRKTGALLKASLAVGGVTAGADGEQVAVLGALGQSLGLLFQVRDDLLDVEGSVERIGKTPGKDELTEKLTYPALFGLEGARAKLQDEADKSRSLAMDLDDTPARQHLLDLIEFLVERDH